MGCSRLGTTLTHGMFLRLSPYLGPPPPLPFHITHSRCCCEGTFVDAIEIQNEFALGKRRPHVMGMGLSSSLYKAKVSLKKPVCLCMPGLLTWTQQSLSAPS